MEPGTFPPAHLDPDVSAAVASFGFRPDALIPVLREVQARRGRLSPEILGAVAEALHVPAQRVFGVATFYSMLSIEGEEGRALKVCDGPVCEALGGDAARTTAEGALRGTGWAVERASCPGLCDRAPAAMARLEPCGPVTDGCLSDWTRTGCCPRVELGLALPGEERVALARVGRIDPESLESAAAAGAYEGLRRVLRSPRGSVLLAVEESGLRGRGDAGFPAGRKWRMVAEAAGTRKTVVCNAGESEPGTFKDRVLMEGDPHRVLEGMALAGLAVGASEGILFVRGEYERAAKRLERAVAAAAGAGWLGEKILGKKFSFRVSVRRGAGAYVCGEETAVLEALEGRRAEPRTRPPLPAACGYGGLPTLVSNAETLAAVPEIVMRGPRWFRSLGTAHSPGTKIFCVSGHVKNPGVFEAPLGTTLRHVLEAFAGGMREGSRFHVALTGGAAGRFVDARALDVPLDYASSLSGPALGTGAMMLFDGTVAVPRLLRSVLRFFETESCGKCTPCREGTREMRVVADRLAEGRGRVGDIEELRRLAGLVGAGSLCGLGRSVAWPVQSAIESFEHEFRAGVRRA